MSKNMVREDDGTIQYTAGATLASGRMKLFGVDQVCILKKAAVSGDVVSAFRKGIFSYARLTGASTAWAAGDKLYYDDTNNRLTKTVIGGAYAGRAHKATVDGDAEGEIILNVGFHVTSV